MNIDQLSCNYFDYLVVTLYVLIILCMLLFFSILGQQWLASTRSSQRGRHETATGGLLLPRAASLLLPRATRWEALAAAAPLLLPRVCRGWEALVAAALLFLPPPTRMTRWRCGWRLLLLLYAYRWLLLLLLQHSWCLLLLRHMFGSALTSKR
jgi:hypothetical protein